MTKFLVSLSLLAALGAVACSSGGGGLECQPGWEPSASGKSCVPILDDAGAPTDVARDVVEVPDVPVVPDVAPADTEVTDGADAGPVDVPPAIDIPIPTGAVGDPCDAPRDCQDGMTCLGWPQGYCSLAGCTIGGDECPEGSSCLALYGDATACFHNCEDVYDCRWWTGDYACKTLPGATDDLNPEGVPTRVCVGLDDEPGENGAACTSHSGCVSELACVQSLPGGNCLQYFCTGPIDCEAEGSACVTWNGLATCMQTCGGDPDCAPAGDGTLVCTELKTVNGNDIDVCASGTSGLPVGRGCLSDFECATTECQLLGTGHCQLGDPQLPCFTEDDCPGLGTCQPTSPPIASCSANCESAGACPGGSGCVREGDADAMCRPSCTWSGSHAFHDCLEASGGTQTGWDCIYGIPQGDESLDGYYCATLRAGEVGSACESSLDCDYSSAICWEWPGASDDVAGYCSRSCGPTKPCAFGTYCFETTSGPRCLKVCAGDLDCPDGYTCAAAPDGITPQKDICQRP